LIPKPLVDLYATHDAEVSPYLVGLTPVEVTRAVRQWVTRAEAITEGPDSPGEAGARVHLSRTLDGRGVLDATLDPDTTTLAETALRIAERPDTPGESLTATERRGEAFGRVMRFYCDHGAAVGDRPGRQHPQVAVVVDPFDLVAGSLRGLGIRTTSDFERFLAVRGMGIFEEGVYRDAFARPDGHTLTSPPPRRHRPPPSPCTTRNATASSQPSPNPTSHPAQTPAPAPTSGLTANPSTTTRTNRIAAPPTTPSETPTTEPNWTAAPATASSNSSATTATTPSDTTQTPPPP